MMIKKTKAQLEEELKIKYAKLRHGYLDISALLEEVKTEVKKIVRELEE